MKKLLILLAIIPIFGFSQEKEYPLPMIDGKVNYSEIVEVEGNSKSLLFSKANLWFANEFNSANDVIQMSDENSGIVLGKGLITQTSGVLAPVKETWEFTVKIQVKDNKYKADIYDFIYTWELIDPNYNNPSTGSLTEIVTNPKIYRRNGELKSKNKELFDKTNSIFTALLESIEKGMTKDLTSDF